MFTPLFCPSRHCAAHTENPERFWRQKGAYRRKCSPDPVPRFQCRHCGVNFSRQTFRADYRDHKPDLNERALSMLASGVGLRQTARELAMTYPNLVKKVLKICRNLKGAMRNLIGDFRDGAGFALDELETFEVCRSTRPLTVPILIEQESTFLVAARSAPIPPSGKMTKARRERIAFETAKHGKRPNRSRQACAAVLARAAVRCANLTVVPFRSDKKATYPKLLREAFGEGRVQHLRIDSKQKRDTTNPLHRINLALARARDLVSRLRRRSWLVSKLRRRLDLHLAAYICYRNYTQPRFNGEEETPAQRLGFTHRRMTARELLAWRQDFGELSTHPLRFCSVAEYRGWIADRGRCQA